MPRFRTLPVLAVLSLSVLLLWATAAHAADDAHTVGDSRPPSPRTLAGNGDAAPTVAGGLPDAITVLDILRSLPGLPTEGVHGVDGGTDEGGPDGVPIDSGTPPGRGQPPPKRVVTIPPNVPFIPRPSPRFAATPPAALGPVVPQMRDREVLVTLTATSDANTIYEVSQDLGLDPQTVYASTLLGTRIIRFRIPDTRSIADVLQQLSTDVRVVAAQPNYVFVASQVTAKPAALPVPQYAPQKLHLEEAHKVAEGKSIKIALIDTAIDATHPALAGTVAESFDALGETQAVPELHGTAIAGIVGARADLVSVAPEASVLAIRAFASDANGIPQSNSLALVRALDWAVLDGARVVNMSFAGPQDSLLGQAIDKAVAQGVVIIAAAGNGGPSASPAYPGAFPHVIAVTATDDRDAIYKNANRGSYIAVAAPGVDIIGAAPGGAYDVSSGTSLAAAHVSGIAALMLQENPGLTPAAIRDKIASSARKSGGVASDVIGAGIADAASAVGASP